MSPKEGDKCPHCGEGTLIFVPELEPYSPDHLSCPICDSTYCIKENL